MSHIDPNNLPPFQIPKELLEQLYEFTGDSSNLSKGFLMAYTNQSGSPMILCKAGSQIVEMGLQKALEQYLIGIENMDSPFDNNTDQE